LRPVMSMILGISYPSLASLASSPRVTWLMARCSLSSLWISANVDNDRCSYGSGWTYTDDRRNLISRASKLSSHSFIQHPFSSTIMHRCLIKSRGIGLVCSCLAYGPFSPQLISFITARFLSIFSCAAGPFLKDRTCARVAAHTPCRVWRPSRIRSPSKSISGHGSTRRKTKVRACGPAPITNNSSGLSSVCPIASIQIVGDIDKQKCLQMHT
jgi:hypothetical protein